MTARSERRYASAMNRALPVVLAAAFASALLTGCAAADGAEQVAPSAAVSAEPTKAPIVGEPGDHLTAEEAAQLNGQMGTLRPYEQNDGSFIIIDVQQPLPDSVKQEVVESIATTDSSDLGSFFRKTDEESSATGKTLIVIRFMSASDLNGNAITAWMASSAATGFPGFNGGSPEDVAAQAQTWANGQRNPAQYEVVIVQG